MTLRLKIIFSLLIGVTILVASFGIFKAVKFYNEKFGKKTEQQQNTVPSEQDSFFTQNNSPQLNQPVQQVVPSAPPSTDDKQRADLISIALPFVERFGSYSNQSNFANLDDLMPFMTAQMQKWAKDKITSSQNSAPPVLYKGVTTKALSQTVVSMDEQKGSAQIKVSTQRKELIGTSTNFKVYNQDVLITFSKEDSAWLVDSAVWQ